MTLLALYWSIMIACYLLASRLRKYAEKFKFVDKLMSLSVYALVLLMGLRMLSLIHISEPTRPY